LTPITAQALASGHGTGFASSKSPCETETKSGHATTINNRPHERHDEMKMNPGKSLALAGAIFALCTLGQTLNAQNQRGNFDPEQMRQRMMERMREQFDVKDDAEWKLIEERITKVMDAQRATRSFAGMGGFGGGRRGGGPGGPGGDQAGAGGGRARGGFGGEPNPDVEALQKAIEAKAPADEIKAKLAKVREDRKAADAKLDAAQDELKKVLSVRQEAVAVMAGLLK
jgi:hypothetical protein